MSSIIPSVGTPPASSNTTSTIVLSNGEVIAEGASRYASNMTEEGFLSQIYSGLALIYTENEDASLVNYGTVWGRFNEVNPTKYDTYLIKGKGLVANYGNAVLEVTTGHAYGIFVSHTLQNHLVNTGQIAISSMAGSAVGAYLGGIFPVATNSGLITAYAHTGMAYGLDFNAEGKLINEASGRIVAEGVDARAVTFGTGTNKWNQDTRPEVFNAGTIEARSLDPKNASIGIYIQNLEQHTVRVVNSGTLIGDYAVYVNSRAYSPPQRTDESVTNTSGGTIEGAIFLDLGNDKLINEGALIGDVLLGEGNDYFDTRMGTWSGLAKLDFGNDVFLGSSGDDVVLGEWGNDTLEGNAGQDLLHGDRGDDTLIGGQGSDGLYGDFGEDRITTEGGDYVLAGSQDDLVKLGDYTFAYVDGNSGIDTLVLKESNHTFDLAAAIATTRIANFEHIVLPGEQRLIVRASDVSHLTDNGNQLLVTADGSGILELVGSWKNNGTQLVNGLSYDAYVLNGEAVLARSGTRVSVVTSASSGAVGLDPIEPGSAAPLPGSKPGTGLLTGETLANKFNYEESIEIEKDEFWHSNNGNVVLGTWSIHSPALTNHGTIVSISEHAPLAYGEGIQVLQRTLYKMGLYGDFFPGRGATAVGVNNSGRITNDGLISAVSIDDGFAQSISVGASGQIINQGRIEAYAKSVANAILTYHYAQFDSVVNEGEIYAESTESHAVGITFGNNPGLLNRGSIEVVAKEKAIAVIAGGSVIENRGLIHASSSGENWTSVAFLVSANGHFRLTNSGLIEADEIVNCVGISDYGRFFITNSGTLNGKMQFFNGYDVVKNEGSIFGDIYMSGGNDSFDGTAGIHTGTVYGEDGLDQLLGGDALDFFDGGKDNDTINGAGGNDILIGGEGNDTLAGGLGIDTAVYRGNSSGFTFVTSLTGIIITDDTGTEGIDTLTGFEKLKFLDKTIDLTEGEHYIGNALADKLNGSLGNDTLDGGDGGDTFNGGAGDDSIIGGSGIDTAVYGGSRSSYSIMKTDLSYTVSDRSGKEGNDTLNSIENMQFADSSISVEYNDAVQALYVAYFGRAADTGGISNFQNYLSALDAPHDLQGLEAQYKENTAVRNLIDAFGTSQESKDLYGAGTTHNFVTSIYKNVLNRTPDPTGIEFWTNAIDKGILSSGNASLSIMSAALSNTSEQGLLDGAIVKKKLIVASNFTFAIDTASEIKAYSGNDAAASVRTLLSNVTSTTDVVATQTSSEGLLESLVSKVDGSMQSAALANAAPLVQVVGVITDVLDGL